jgi:UDP-N-acetylenolpyruvoylglucosamine reductase
MTATAPILPAGELFSQLKERLSKSAVIRENELLSRRTTLRVGGPADVYVEPASEVDLRELVRFCGETETPWMMLGRGSNLLVRDGGIRGVVIFLGSPFAAIEVSGSAIRCGAGARLRSVAAEARKHALTGCEFMEGIPGNMGGALRMNAGAMGSSVFELVESVRFMDADGEIEEQTAAEIPVEYRSCPLFKTRIALAAMLRGRPADARGIEQKMKECFEKRRNSQPAAASAGCIFKNSATISTGRLVEELGLKGARVGGAVISEEHGNFIVNDRHATARDIMKLMERVKETALQRRAIELQTEVQIVGEDS